MDEQLVKKSDDLTSGYMLNVSANHASLIARFLSTEGVDANSIFAELSLEVPKLNSPVKRISAVNLIDLIKLAIRETGDPAIGQKIYTNIKLADLDALGFALSCSSTFLSLLQRFQRFMKYMLSNSVMQIVEENDGYLILVDIEEDENLMTPDQDDAAIRRDGKALLIECFAQAFLSISSEICQQAITPKAVYFNQITHPLVKQEIKNQFGVDPTFAPFYGAKLDKALVEKKLPHANPEMARINDEVLLKHMQEIYKNDIAHQVEAAIREGLPRGNFSRSQIATTLGYSERSLQERLEERKTSFSNILLRTRKTLAMQYLREDKLRMNQIAYSLGFANGSNFTRSFKSWTGYSPKDFKDL